MDGAHHTTHHQLYQGLHLLRSRRGSPFLIQKLYRGLRLSASHVQVPPYEPPRSQSFQRSYILLSVVLRTAATFTLFGH